VAHLGCRHPVAVAVEQLLRIAERLADCLEHPRDPDRGKLILGEREEVFEQHGCRSNLLPLAAIWQQDFTARTPWFWAARTPLPETASDRPEFAVDRQIWAVWRAASD
jgi:hypothetical protein